MDRQNLSFGEMQGPMDLRPIDAEDVHPISAEMTHALRSVWPAEGHRMAVATSMAAVLAGVIVLGELGGDQAVVDTLRRHLATAKQRVAARASGVCPSRLQ